MDDKQLDSPRGANVQRKSALGRGLASLMTSTSTPLSQFSKPREIGEVSTATTSESENTNGMTMLDIHRIVRSDLQPRRDFKEQELEGLANSIRINGILQPIVVRKKEGSANMYEIVAGERRWRASQRVGLAKIPAIIKELDDREAFGIALLENVQRADLNAIEEALAYQRLIEEFQETQQTISEKVGKDRASISNALRILKLPKDIQQLISSGELSAGHGRALLQLPSEEEQRKLAQEILKTNLSVRASEKLASQRVKTTESGEKIKTLKVVSEKSASAFSLEDRLRKGLGTKVSVIQTEGEKTEVRVSFYSHADLESFLERLGC
jgi:ParB family transcriptional regulator, chromosome partitioning protein